MARIQPTDEQLQAAFARLRRASWPPTLAAALASPLHAALLRGDAVRHALRHPAQPAAAAPARSVPVPRAAAHFDRKRAASGERDDD